MSAEPELLTPRLRLRTWRPADEAEMAAINRDPEVTRYLNRATDRPAMDAYFARTVAHWDEHGFGHFALEARDGPLAGHCIGFVGVAFPTFLPAVADRPELGWRLAREAWGQGFATEAGLAAREDAVDRLGLAELISIVHPENARSRRVAGKLGMSIERQVHNPVLDRQVDVWRFRPAAAQAGLRPETSRL